ncbi:MAG TPA: GNAT family protein [Chloroflexia bacterium]|nr:GNAT family protein [Chloroflexia bacterium]
MENFIAPDNYQAGEFVLRSYRPEDGPLINQAINSSYEHLRTFMPWAKPDTPLEESVDFCRKACARYLLNQDFTLAVVSPDGKSLLGGTGFHLRNRSLSDKSGEIGMWIRADQAGSGLGTRVLKAMLEWGFTEWPWERLFWRCDTRNIASARVAEKAGMLKEGCLRGELIDHNTGVRRDTYYFGMLKSDWETAHRKS